MIKLIKENIYTGYYDSPIGLLKIEGSDNELYSIQFCEKKEKSGSLEAGAVLKCINQLDEYFQGIRKEFNLKLRQKGTAFQQNVWSELIKIEYGKTITYKELSGRIGNLNAFRAVGTACGRNNIPIILPCHRVIGINGKLVGYAGGLWRKEWLLIHEIKFSKSKDLFQ